LITKSGKGRLVNIVIASFDVIMEQMTEMCQWKKQLPCMFIFWLHFLWAQFYIRITY